MVQVIKFILHILEEILGSIIELFFDYLNSLIKPKHKTEYDADFLPRSEILSKENQGFCLNGKESLTIEDSFKNALIIGSTGAFKSSGVLIPSLLRMAENASIVVTDFSGELLLKTSGALLANGYDISVLDFGNPELSEGYNPLGNLSNSMSEVQKLSKAEIATEMGTGGKDPFWNLAAEGLMTLITKFVLKHVPKEHHSLFTVYTLISMIGSAHEKVDRLFVRANDAELLNEYKTFVAYGDKVVASIIATCRAALAIFGTDPAVALTTSHNTIDFTSFRKQKKVLYIKTNTKDMRYYSLITSIFLDQFFGAIMTRLPDKKDLPIFFLIDEASSLRFDNLQLIIANIRKYNAGILQVYQSAAQLVDLYGQPIARAITENSYTRVYMPGQPINVAQELEATLGKFEYADEKDIRHIRPLLTADEIRKLDESLILCGNKAAVKTKITPYFKQPKLRKLTELPPYVPTNKLPFSQPPVLSLD